MRPIIALDADGVLLNYHQAYQLAWQRAFDVLPALRDPMAYWPIDRWDVRRLNGNELDQFRRCFDYQYWANIPAIEGALHACQRLHEAGYDLVCVSAIKPEFLAARQQNLRDLGFPIEWVIATASEDSKRSPKALALRELAPIAFVDDYLPYLRGIPGDLHAALILREPNGSPNVGEETALAHSTHSNLADFADWWLNFQSHCLSA